MKKIIALLLSLSLAINFTLSSFATVSTTAERASFSDLPEEYQEFIDPNAIIYRNSDGGFDIYQDEPIAQTNLITRASSDEFYYPNGGSYSHIECGQITSITSVMYQTYLPRDEVDLWLADNTGDAWDYISSLLIAEGANYADEIATKVLAKYGINMSISSIVQVLEGTAVVLDYLNKSQVNSASDYGRYGILIEYLVTVGDGASRVYSRWSDSYIPTEQYGGSAVWHPDDYYVMPD